MVKSAVAEPTPEARATEGDDARAARDARLRAMVEAHYTNVWRALRRLGVARADAEDAAQDVFLSASRRLSDIEPGKERAFLLATAVHHAAHAHRSRLRRREVLGDALPDAKHPSPGPDEALPDAKHPSPGPHELAERARVRELVYVLLDELPFDERTVFVLYEIEQLTMAEIATLLDLPSGTVASRLRRAREKFSSLAEGSAQASELRGGKK
jgi:RNA polymerase sigma-70 factor (ECF subfamily)